MTVKGSSCLWEPLCLGEEDLSSLSYEISVYKTTNLIVFAIKWAVFSAFMSKRSIAIPLKTFLIHFLIKHKNEHFLVPELSRNDLNKRKPFQLTCINYALQGWGIAGFLSPESVLFTWAWPPCLADAERIIEDYVYPFSWHLEKSPGKSQQPLIQISIVPWQCNWTSFFLKTHSFFFIHHGFVSLFVFLTTSKLCHMTYTSGSCSNDIVSTSCISNKDVVIK